MGKDTTLVDKIKGRVAGARIKGGKSVRKILLTITLLVAFPIYAAITVSTVLFSILVFAVSGHSFLEEGEISKTWKHFKECFFI